MRMDDLKRMKMPSKGKPDMSIAIGVGKPKSDADMESGESSEEESDEKSTSIEDASEMQLLDELKERGCVDDRQYSEISKHIETKQSGGEYSETGDGSGDGSSGASAPDMGNPSSNY